MSSATASPSHLFAKVWWRDTLTGKEGVHDERQMQGLTIGSVWLDEDGEPNWYMWEDGNYSCNCNRALFFLGAGLDSVACGDGRFEILKREAVSR